MYSVIKESEQRSQLLEEALHETTRDKYEIEKEVSELLDTFAELELSLEEKEDGIFDLEIETQELIRKLDTALADKLQEQKLKYYHKKRCQQINLDSEDDVNRSKIKVDMKGKFLFSHMKVHEKQD